MEKLEEKQNIHTFLHRVKTFFKESWQAFKKVPSWLVAFSAVATILMNLLANKTLVSIGSIEGLGGQSWLQLDCGFLVSWVMFLSMDVIVQRQGAKASFAVTVFDVLVALIMSAIMCGIAAVPESWGAIAGAYPCGGWGAAGGDAAANSAIDATIGSSMAVVGVSMFAFICSTLVDILLNKTVGKLFVKHDNFKDHVNVKSAKGFFIFFSRTYVSTLFAQFVDNLVFQMIAYPLLFGMGWNPVGIIVGAAIGSVAELLMEFVFAPIGYKAVCTKRVGESEGVVE